MSYESDKQLDTDVNLYASRQGFALSLFGYLFAVAAILHLLLIPTHPFNRLLWAILGPIVAWRAVDMARQRHPKAAVAMYSRVLIGALPACGVIAFAVRQDWVVPATLVVLATIIGLIAWLEENPVGMTGAISMALLGAGTSVAAFADQQALSYGLIAVMLLAAEPLLDRFVEAPQPVTVVDVRSGHERPPMPALSQVAANKS